MNQNRVASLIGTVLLLCPLAAAPAGAQGIVVKKKVVSPDQYQKMVAPDTRAALSGETLRNGDYVSVQRKGETNRINGVFVYEDAQKIYVRSQPQAAPTGVPLKEIEDIDRIVPANTEKAKGGSIRFATEDLSGAPPREIHVLHVYNGTTKEVRYYGPTLSAAEKQDLAALEKAANQLATDQEMAQALERSLAEPAGRTDTGRACPQRPWLRLGFLQHHQRAVAGLRIRFRPAIHAALHDDEWRLEPHDQRDPAGCGAAAQPGRAREVAAVSARTG